MPDSGSAFGLLLLSEASVLRIARIGAVTASILWVGTCSVVSEPFETPSPVEVSPLERIVREDSTDVEAVARLATGYLAEGRAEDARAILSATHRRVPGEPTILVALGVVEQALEMYASAADRYRRYLDMGGGALSESVRARLDAIRNEALRAEMRALLASRAVGSESEVSDGSPEPSLDADRVVILPFVTPVDDPELQALGTGLTWKLARDLGREGLDVVDRNMVRALVDVLEVPTSEGTELSLALDVGGLLGAAHVIVARLERVNPEALSWMATTVSRDPGGRIRVAPVEGRSGLSHILDLESYLAELARRSIEGEPLMPRPGQLSARGSPSNPEALLAFGRGLQAMDSGAHAQAESALEAAGAADPEFDRAEELARRAGLARAAAGRPLVATLEDVVRVGELQRAVLGLREMPGAAQQEAEARVGGRHRAEISEILGLDRPGGSVLLEVIFTPAGGAAP